MFTLDLDNNIVAHSGLPASANQTQSFATAQELAKVAAEWPVSRLVEIWNSFAGVAPFDDLRPVTKFKDRETGVARIWKAMERLAANVAEPAATSAPTEAKLKKDPAKATKPATARKGEAKTPKATKETKGPKTAKESKAKKAPGAAKDGSNKKSEVIAMMGRGKGCTLAEIMEHTGWQAHTVRGFISIQGSKHGLKIESSKNDSGDRTYRIVK